MHNKNLGKLKKLVLESMNSKSKSLIKLGKFKDTPFCRNNKFNALPRNMLLENVIQHMNLCLLSNRKHDEYFELF